MDEEIKQTVYVVRVLKRMLPQHTNVTLGLFFISCPGNGWCLGRAHTVKRSTQDLPIVTMERMPWTIEPVVYNSRCPLQNAFFYL